MRKRKHRQKLLFGLHDQDIVHHALLTVIILVGFAAMITAQGNPFRQFMIGLVTAIGYVGWGIYHHYADEDLHARNVVEYVLIALLGVLILGGILL